jgi:hypothetical protein
MQHCTVCTSAVDADQAVHGNGAMCELLLLSCRWLCPMYLWSVLPYGDCALQVGPLHFVCAILHQRKLRTLHFLCHSVVLH